MSFGKNIAIFFFIGFINCSFGQVRFKYFFESHGNEGGYTIEENDTGYCIFSAKIISGGYDLKRYLIDNNGILQDTSYVQNINNSNTTPYKVFGSYYLSGYKDSLFGISNTPKPFIAKLDSDLDTVWTFHLDTIPRVGTFTKVLPSHDDNIYVTGYFDPTGQDLNYKGFLAKIDTNGNFIWMKKYLSTTGTELITSAVLMNNRLYLAGGSNSGGNGSFDSFLMKVDTSGNKIWENWWGSPFSEMGQCMALNDTNILLFGGINNAIGNMSNYLVKVDTASGTIWEEVFNFSTNGSDEAIKAFQLSDGAIIVAGHTEDSQNSGDRMGLLYKIDTARNIMWTRKYKVRGNDHYFSDMILTSDEGFAMVGYLFPDSPYNQDIWAVKVDSMGCDVPLCYLGERELGLELPILKCYPNPTSAISTIELLENSREIQLYNSAGILQKKFAIQNNQKEMKLDLSLFPHDIYILRLLDKNGVTIGQGKVVKR